MPIFPVFRALGRAGKKLANINPPIISARVKKTILEGETNPKVWKKYGEYQCIGGIFWTQVNLPNTEPNFESYQFALPLFPNLSQVPLENEIVYVIQLPSNNVQASTDSVQYYYFQSVNIWGSVHHNAIPDSVAASLNGDTDAQTRDYQQIEGGTYRATLSPQCPNNTYDQGDLNIIKRELKTATDKMVSAFASKNKSSNDGKYIR